MFKNRHVDRAPSIRPHDVDLYGRGVRGCPYLFQEHRNTVSDFDREVVHFLDERYDAVAVDVVVEIADLHITCRHQQILGIDRLHHLVNAHTPREHLLSIQKYRNLPNGSSECWRKRYSLDGTQLRTDCEIGDVAHLFLAEARTAQH